MPKKESGLGYLEQIAVKTAADMGFELIELELAKEPQGLFLRFLIDKPGGITIDDCEVYHKTMQPHTETVDFDYMEVSSPGADRPLKKPEDFARAKGKRVEVRLYKPDMGAKIHEGELIGLEEGAVAIRSDKGETLSFALKAVAIVKPLIEFDEEDLQDESAPEGGDE
ncbi:MAG: ribosome maturation factor RimP [Eubacteriales bacterium]|nr:ribosome maturation factor RimP [Eubacteriales bacterium]